MDGTSLRGHDGASALDLPWAAVPAEVADLLRPALPGVVDEIVAAVRATVVEYDQPLEGEFGRLIREGAAAALVQFVDLLGRADDLPDTGVYEAIGRAEFRAGRTLDALQSAYRVGARVTWRVAAQRAGASLDASVLVVLAEAIFAYIDRLADASVAGYAREQSVLEGSAQTRRQALVEICQRRGARPAGGRACRRAGGVAAAGAAGGGGARRRRSAAGVAAHAGRHDRGDAGGGRRVDRARSGRAGAAAAARGGPAPHARRARPDGAVGARARVGAPGGHGVAAARGGPAGRRDAGARRGAPVRSRSGGRRRARARLRRRRGWRRCRR